MTIDLAVFATIASIVIPLIGALWRFFSALSRLEREIERGKAERKLLKERCDAALRFHDHRIRQVEETLEGTAGFSPQYRRDDGCTGASFLEKECLLGDS
jgi:hypothetical protein